VKQDEENDGAGAMQGTLAQGRFKMLLVGAITPLIFSSS